MGVETRNFQNTNEEVYDYDCKMVDKIPLSDEVKQKLNIQTV